MESMSDLFEPLSTFDMAVIYSGMTAPWIGVVAATVLLAAIAVLAFATREPGRIELFVGVYLFVAEFVIFVRQFTELTMLGGGLVREAWMRILGVLPLILIAVGITRICVAAVRRRRAGTGAG
jgi:hypothetical protein